MYATLISVINIELFFMQFVCVCVSCPTYLINSIFFDERKYTTIDQAIYREIIFILNKIIQWEYVMLQLMQLLVNICCHFTALIN
jgi:hypothetical protein